MKFHLAATASAFLLALAACSGPADETPPEQETADTGTEPEALEPVDDAPADPTGTTVDALQLIKLDCGSIYVSDLGIFSTEGDYDGETDTFTDTCWLIRHPEGDLLWDLGLPGILTSQDEQTTGVFTVSLEETIAEQLEDMDLSMADIEYLAVSHSHFDHVGQVDLIDHSGTTWLVNQAEYDYMFQEEENSEAAADDADTSDAADDAAYEDDGSEGEASRTDAAAQFPSFELLQRETILDNHDVFGDGSVVIFMTPGHTPGHSSLLVNLPETGPVLLTGDLYHRSESRELKRVPQFNTSVEETLASMDAFEARADELGAKVIIQHEADDTEGLPDVMR